MSGHAAKVISVEQALDLLDDGDDLVVGLGANEPPTFMSQLHTVGDRLDRLTVTNCLPLIDAPYLDHPSFYMESWFYTPIMRRIETTGRVTYVPNRIHQIALKFNARRHAKMMVSLASTPGSDGRIRLALGNTYEERIGERSRYRILEVSSAAPRVYGQNWLEPEAIDYIIESDAAPATIKSEIPTDIDRQVAEVVAGLVNDGDCVQIGIGGIPEAVCDCLTRKRDLGIHTEMMNEGLMKLIRAGAVTNARKQVDVGKSVFMLAAGSPSLYAELDDNPTMWVGRGESVNEPSIIALNHNQVSINTTIEIDITGQCSSESIGPRQISGAGGQSDTARGAIMSPGGRSIIALSSVHERFDRASGQVLRASKIVPTLRPAAAVTLSRVDVDWVVTEFGAVYLRGTGLEQRVRLLISIAHPEFREALTRDAIAYGYLPSRG
ncbi:MAG: hypothetical protein LBV30_03150 [Propionibacteriaceae bacterium]|nr:hypothetical protein [Propionibacteriaceae bacterium]